MNKRLKAKWVKALRSGKFKQAKDALCRYDQVSGEYGFCCLGVLAHIAIDAPWEAVGAEYHTFNGNSGSIGILSTRVRKKVGLDSEAADTLISKNDNGQSFKQIALWIERNL